MIGFILLVIILFMAFSESKEEQLARLENEANSAYADGDYSTALKNFEKILEDRPNRDLIHYNIGKAYLRLADFDRAELAFRKSIELNPLRFDSVRELCRIRMLANDLKSVEQILSTVDFVTRQIPELLIVAGDLAIRREQYSTARGYYEKAFEIKPKDPVAKIKLSTCLLIQGEHAKADTLLQEVVSTNPIDPEVRIMTAEYHKINGDFEKADEIYAQISQMSSIDLLTKSYLANHFFNIQNYIDAKRLLEQLSRQVPRNLMYKKMLAEIHINQRNLEKANEILTAIGEEGENDIGWHLLVGKYQMANGQPAIAATYFEYVTQKDAGSVIAHYLLGIAYLAAGHNQLGRQSLIKAVALDKDFIEADLALADYHFRKKEYDLALGYAGRVAKHHPDSKRAHLIMAHIFRAQNQIEKASQKFRLVLMIDPESLSAAFYYARLIEAQHQKNAVDIYRRLHEQYPNLVDVSQCFAELLEQLDTAFNKKTFFSDAVKKKPDNPFFHFLLGELYLESEEFDAAEKELNLALKHLPKMRAAYMVLAEIQGRKGDFKAKIKILEKAVEIVPDFHEAYLELGNTFILQENYVRAIKVLEEAVSKNPDNVALINNLAYLYLEYGDRTVYNKALELAQTAYENKPDSPEVLDTIGWGYFRKRLYLQSIIYLSDAIKIVENLEDVKMNKSIIYFHLAAALETIGDKEKSEAVIDTAIRKGFGKDFKEKIQVLLGTHQGL